MAELAAEAAGAPVAIVVPRLGAAVALAGRRAPTLAALRRYVADRARGRPAPVPPGVGGEVPIAVGRRDRRRACCCSATPSRARGGASSCTSRRSPALTEVAVEEAREEVEQNLRGSFLEELRSRPRHSSRARSCAARARLGCDLSRGAVVLCAELTTDRPRHVVATIAGRVPGRARPAHGRPRRVYALLPARRRRPRRRWPPRAAWRRGCSATAPSASRPSTATRASSPRAIQEAELVLDVLRRSEARRSPRTSARGTYRLLFRVLASHPEEVRSFYEDTVAPLVRYDDQYATDLVGTLEAYLEHNCNMNATAAAIYAHRHTVAYRLERVKELTGLDPAERGPRAARARPQGLPDHRAAAAALGCRDMKKVEAFIRHEAFEPIRNDLLKLGFPSLSISEVKGSGRQKGITERYRGAELTNWLRPKVKLECVVASGDVETVVETILKHARTGSIGDGKVFVMPVEEAYRIRTGESGEETLQAHPGAADEIV